MAGPTKYGGQTVTNNEKLQLESQAIGEFLNFVPEGSGFVMKFKYPEKGSYTPKGASGPVTFNIRENMNYLQKGIALLVTGGKDSFGFTEALEDGLIELTEKCDPEKPGYDPESVMNKLNIPAEKRAEFGKFMGALGEHVGAIAQRTLEYTMKLRSIQKYLSAYEEHPELEDWGTVKEELKNIYPDYERAVQDYRDAANMNPQTDTDVKIFMDCETSANLNSKIAECVNIRREREGKEPLQDPASHNITFTESKDGYEKNFEKHFCFTSTVNIGRETKVMSIEMTAPPASRLLYRDEKGTVATGIYDTMEELDKFHADNNLFEDKEKKANIISSMASGFQSIRDESKKDVIGKYGRYGLDYTGSAKMAEELTKDKSVEKDILEEAPEIYNDRTSIPVPGKNPIEFMDRLSRGEDYPILCEQIAALTDGDAKSIADNTPKGDVQVFSADMKPIDFSDRASLQSEMVRGMYVFNKGEAEPHKLVFDSKSNALVYENKAEAVMTEAPKAVKKPGRFARAVNGFLKALGGKGLDSCNKYDKYVKDTDVYNKYKDIVVNRAKTITAGEQTAANRQTIQNKYSQAQKHYLDLSAKQDLEADLKLCYEQGARGFEKLGTASDLKVFAGQNDTALARIALANALAKEEAIKKDDPGHESELGDFIRKNGFKNTLRMVNSLPSIKAAKQNLSTTSVRRMINSNGDYISKNLATELARSQQAKVKQIEAPSLNGPDV